MSENLNYISEEELERLINQVEQEELVAAPPDLMERILDAELESAHLMCCETSSILEEERTRIPNVSLMTDEFSGRPVDLSSVKPAAAQKKEFYAYCFRVITSVAAAIALVFLLPELTERMNLNGMPSWGYADKGMSLLEKPGSGNEDMPLWSVDEETEGNTAQGRWQTTGKTIPSKAEVTEGDTAPSKSEVAAENTVPSKSEVLEVKTAPSKAEVIAGWASSNKAEAAEKDVIPSKEDVLNDTGFIGKVINSTRWFNKDGIGAQNE